MIKILSAYEKTNFRVFTDGEFYNMEDAYEYITAWYDNFEKFKDGLDKYGDRLVNALITNEQEEQDFIARTNALREEKKKGL